PNPNKVSVLLNSTRGSFVGPAYTLDQIPPQVASIRRTTPAGAVTAAGSVTFTVTFDKPVSGVDAGDFRLAVTGATPAALAQVAAMVGAVNAGPVSGIAADGAVGLTLADDDSVTDLGGNLLGGTGPGNGDFTGETYTPDHPPPAVVSINRDAPAAPVTDADSV